MTQSEPRNPLYLLLLVASFVFVINAVAVAVVPTLEQRAADAGQPPPPSPLRDALRQDGWKWLLYELAVMVVFAILSMAVDRLRRLQRERSTGTIPLPNDPATPG